MENTMERKTMDNTREEQEIDMISFVKRTKDGDLVNDSGFKPFGRVKAQRESDYKKLAYYYSIR